MSPGPSPAPPPKPVVSSPRLAAAERISVAVGLSPEAPGSTLERQALDQLERSAAASTDPLTQVRRLPPGLGDGRQICRDRRDDLVVLVGYVPTRPEPVILAQDCALDVPLSLHAVASTTESELIGVLWAEHQELVRQGAKERRRLGRLSTKARIGVAAAVVVVVVGTALGLLVANALRDHRVVLKVSP